MKHDSLYGTTCWFCGHPGTRTRKTDEGPSARACDSCRNVKGSAAEIRTLRNADVEALARQDQEHQPRYWTEQEFAQLLQDYSGLPRGFVDSLRCQPFHDEYLQATKARLTTAAIKARKEHYDKVGREARRVFYQQEKERKLKAVQQALKVPEGEKK